MHPVRKQRLYIVLFIVVGASVAAGLIFYALSENLNLFYSILEKIEIWENLNQSDKLKLICNYMNIKEDNHLFVDYFDKYRDFILKNPLKNFTKDILEFKF